MTSNALKTTLLAAALALGSLNAHALESDRQQPISIDADQGSPVYFRQELDGNKGLAEGWGDRAEYTSTNNTVKLVGNAKVRRGGDVATGNAISYNTKTEVYTVLGGKTTGGKDNPRVHIIIQPSTAQGDKKK